AHPAPQTSSLDDYPTAPAFWRNCWHQAVISLAATAASLLRCVARVENETIARFKTGTQIWSGFSLPYNY
ncbi:hypothetical protein, partial [uncultured Pigmentiphaga sp.]|uniref:hypothetical protein n=1 Tax=uncultured Pigmentiphaga sp. TaxID=340361 RepID=UPI00261794C9